MERDGESERKREIEWRRDATEGEGEGEKNVPINSHGYRSMHLWPSRQPQLTSHFFFPKKKIKRQGESSVATGRHVSTARVTDVRDGPTARTTNGPDGTHTQLNL